jgi:adenylate cyclase
LLKDKYLLEKRGLIKIKGKGEMMTYLLHDKKI